MIPEFGQFALVLALCLALVQATMPLIGAAQGKVTWMQLARPLAIGQFVFLAIAFLCLAYAFLSNDFSVLYVAKNSNTHLPIFYKFCAIWGAHEGSILLWSSILGLWMALVSIYSRSLPLETVARVLSVLAMISVGLLLFMLFTSNPFIRLLASTPTQGADLNPLLQDPGLALHPPLLYIGYVGFAVPFAFAIAALIGGRLDAVWARWSRPWTQVAWCFLSLGIILGSWWSYRELGWGGWWAWDPVENASLMPWIVGTALIHSLAATEKRNVFKAWTVLLAICTFALSLIGTFLVRSGILISVHAFAVDPQRGTFLLYFLTIVIGGSLLLYACRASIIKSPSHFKGSSLETFLLYNNVLLFVLMLTVALGTLYPLLAQVLGMGKLSVGPPYFNILFVPLSIPLLFLMGFGPLAQWRSTPLKKLAWKTAPSLGISVFIGIILLWIFTDKIQLLMLVLVTLSLWITLTATQEILKKTNSWKLVFIRASRTQYGKTIAHIGVAVCVIGIAITSIYSVQREVFMKIGDTLSISPYTFKFSKVDTFKGSNYDGVRAEISVSKNHHPLSILYPEIRTYRTDKMSLPKAALDAGIFRDLYATLGKPLPSGGWTMRLYYKPFVRWIWWGGCLIALGGLLAAADKRYRRLKKEGDPL